MGLRDEISKQQESEAREKRYQEELAEEKRKRLAEFDKAAPELAFKAALESLTTFKIEPKTLSGKKSERLNNNQPDTSSEPFWRVTFTCSDLRPAVLLVIEMKAGKHPSENRPIFYVNLRSADDTTVTVVESGKKPVRVREAVDLAPYLKN